MKQINNWKLIVFFVALLIIFLCIRFFYSPKMISNIPSNLTNIDSATVTSIYIQPAMERNLEINLVRQGENWILKKDKETFPMELETGVGALRALMNLKPLRLVSKKKEKWKQFNVSDSTGTKVKVFKKDAVEADLIIGRSDVITSGTGGFAGMHTYVRRLGEDEVYAVEAFLEGQFNRTLDDWRDKNFIRLQSDSVDQITFMYPADSSFVLQLKLGKWRIDDQFMADSASVKNYIIDLGNKKFTKFALQPPVGIASSSIVFGYKGKMVAKLEAWTSSSSDVWTMRSSVQSKFFVTSEGTTIISDVWKGKSAFLKTK